LGAARARFQPDAGHHSHSGEPLWFVRAPRVWLNDERFFKMKTYMRSTLLVRGAAGDRLLALAGKSYLKYVMEEMMPLNDAAGLILTKRLMLCFLVRRSRMS